MSVLIKGMEMPKSCDVCCFDLFVESCPLYNATPEELVGITWIKKARHRYCPLVEIPPHGRLIDAVERKKGKWEGNTKDESWKCSECGFIFYSVGFYNIYNTKFRMRFCPNCGANMMEEI